MKKERRRLEAAVQDHEAKLMASKTRLGQVKSNQEYTAALKEIEALGSAIDAEEERLLELMDRLDSAEPDQKARASRLAGERSTLEARRGELTDKAASLEATIRSLEGEKPGFLAGLSDRVRRQYTRLLTRYGDSAVVRLSAEHCGGCGTQLPPQVAVEVGKNNQLITCQSCGRILVFCDA
jgi:predicted  nucleic acid-binding Zn-ribbon protein